MQKDNHNRQNIDEKNCNDDKKSGLSAKLRAFIAGLTPCMIFRFTLISSVIVALVAGILYRTASKSLHVNIDKVDTASISLTGSQDLGGIEPGGYRAVEYSITNHSTKPAYVFIRVTEATVGLYEIVGSDGEVVDGWCRVTEAEQPGEIILAYGTSAEMTPVGIGEEVTMSGRLHCLASAEVYSQLTGDDLDIDVDACLVYGMLEDGSGASYNTSAESLWQAYSVNKE